MPNRLLFVPLCLSALCLACTTKTVIEHRADPPAEASSDGTDPAEDEVDAGAAPASSGDDPTPARPDPSDPTDAGGTMPSPAPDASTDAGTGTILTGGKIVLTCPSSGFHKPDPITIASLPTSLLPRCSSTTKACAYGAATSQAYDACLAADTTPPATFDGEAVDCSACDRTQGSNCLASACRAELSAYACCAQANGEAACTSLRTAMTSCAGGSGKPAFDACIAALVGACFS